MFDFAFNGKAPRGEYWRIYLSWFCVTLLVGIIAIATTIGSISSLVYGGGSIIGLLGGWFFILLIMGLVAFVSCLAVTVRRCNDIGINPFWSLTTLVPYIGFGAILIFGVLDSNQHPIVGLSVRFGEGDNQGPKNSPNFSNESDPAPMLGIRNDFSGEKNLSNDAYQLFLLEKYAIKKNDVLNKFICKDKIFNTVDDAIAFAAQEELRLESEAMEKELKRIQEQERIRVAEEKAAEEKRAIALESQRTWEAQRIKEEKIREQKRLAYEPIRLARRRRIILSLIIGLFLLILCIAGMWWKYEANHAYSKVRTAVLEAGWEPYIRASGISEWKDSGYPESQFCIEDICTNQFINKAYPDKVRQIQYGRCGGISWAKCPFYFMDSQYVDLEMDSIISKSNADSNFENLKKEFLAFKSLRKKINQGWSGVWEGDDATLTINENQVIEKSKTGAFPDLTFEWTLGEPESDSSKNAVYFRGSITRNDLIGYLEKSNAMDALNSDTQSELNTKTRETINSLIGGAYQEMFFSPCRECDGGSVYFMNNGNMYNLIWSDEAGNGFQIKQLIKR